MLKRKITEEIRKWFEESSNGLLIDGAGQVGKTTAIEEFLKNNKIDYIELNLAENRLARQAFNDFIDEKHLMLRISSLVNKPLTENKTVIFIDEIQMAEDAITPIKFLVQNTKFRFVFSGSLLGVKLKNIESVPVGYLKVLQMYPLDFEEFVSAVGVSEKTRNYLKECYDHEAKVDDVIHKQMMSLFDIYLVVGGMPRAVTTFLTYNDVSRVNQVLSDIDDGYRLDISKYEKENKLLIEDIYDLIPSELNNQNKRFILKNLNEKAKFYQYETSFAWIKNSGVGLFAYNVDNPVYPLMASKERTLFKLFPSDVGLLTCKLFNGNQISILNGGSTLNFGAVYESVVAQELKTHGYELYYNSDKKRGEIDFLIEDGNAVIPIEVKSGKDYKRHSAMTQLMNHIDFHYEKGIVLCNGNVERKDRIVYLPIYMIMYFVKKLKAGNQFVRIEIPDLI